MDTDEVEDDTDNNNNKNRKRRRDIDHEHDFDDETPEKKRRKISEPITTPPTEQSAVQRIDDALAQYYTNMRGKNSNYYNDRNDGIFAIWCDDNGYDDDMMDDELGNNADPADCALTDFTDEFPFNNNDVTLTEQQEKYEIFKILQHCYKYGFDIRIKYGFDPLSDLSNTQIFLFKYVNINDNDKACDIIYDLSQMDLENTIKMYQSQCDSVFGKKIVTDTSFEYGLAIGIKNNYFPYLQYLVDIYMKYCLQFVLKDINNRTLNQTKFTDFLRKNTSVYTKLDKNIVQKLIGAVDIYLRLCPMMHITKPLTIINDNIKHIIQYLIIINHIIQYIITENKENSIQFQFDVTIACNSTHSTQKMCQPIFDDDSDESSEETDQIDEPIVDVLGNVHRKLNANNLKNIGVTLSAIRKPENMNTLQDIDDLDLNKLTSLCLETYNIKMEQINELNSNQNFAFMNNEFKNNNFQRLCDIFSKCRLVWLQRILDKDYKELNISNIILFDIIDFELECNDIKHSLMQMLDDNSNKDHFDENKKAIMDKFKQFESLFTSNVTGEVSGFSPQYPYKHRINMFIDRRCCNYENSNKHNFCDDIIFYECPFGSNILPFGNNETNNNLIVHESYFNLTQKCLIPKIGYKNGENEAMYTMNMQPKERIRNSTFSCRTAPPGGSVLIFSFHIISKDIIKCYLFRDAQFTRFLPQDIKLILPHLFNLEYNNNCHFMNNDNKIYEMISQLNYSDKLFNSWYNNRTKKI